MTDTEHSPAPAWAADAPDWSATRLVEPAAAPAPTAYAPRHAWRAADDGRTRFAPTPLATPLTIPDSGHAPPDGFPTDQQAELDRRLATLGSQWHCVPWGPAVGSARDLDHVVIGPAGVFTIMTKRHLDARIVIDDDTVTVDGFEQPYLAQARAAADRIARRLTARARFDVEVHALLVLTSNARMVIEAQPADGSVHVLTRPEVVPYLWSLPRALGTPSIERITAVASSAELFEARPVEGDVQR